MSEESKSFTVKDRRHFTPDGRTREPEEAEASPPEPAPETPPPVGADSSPSLPADEEPADAGPTGPVDFGQFLISLGAQAGMLLSGQIEGQSAAQALGEARSMIGILEMLKDKTEGRRTPREDQVLDGLLYELRMAYVARARGAGA
jgi:hypothetical protein